jgi:hypothetical protein
MVGTVEDPSPCGRFLPPRARPGPRSLGPCGSAGPRSPGTSARSAWPALRALEPAEPVQRYEWDRPGDLVHPDIKKLGPIGRIGHRITGARRARVRGIGWEYVPVAVDDATRLAYVEVLPDEQGVLARPARPDVNATGRLLPLRLDERLRGHAVHCQGPGQPL